MESLSPLLVTAGATREPIDDVRFITNFSSGNFGRAFARKADEAGVDVTLVAAPDVDPVGGDVERRTFTTTESLKDELNKLSDRQDWDGVIHSAAISDYTPVQETDGKIRSHDRESLTLELERTPKIISKFRTWFNRAFLVGFKLLTDASDEQLFEAAYKQIKSNRLDLCVANDLSEISSDSHCGSLVTPEGGQIELPEGSKEGAAMEVLSFSARRADTTWYHTTFDEELHERPTEPDRNRGESLLNAAQDLKLLVDKSGNASLRLNDRVNEQFAITPRQVDKSAVDPDDLKPVIMNWDHREVRTAPPDKASIDSSVSGRLYDEYEGLEAILHTHSPFCITDRTTDFPYPCGVKEEADEVLTAMDDEPPFLVELTHHGFLLGIDDLNEFHDQYRTVQRDFREHLQDVGVADQVDPSTGKLRGLLGPEGLIGHLFESGDGALSPRILPEHQGQGYGRKLVDVLHKQNSTVRTIDECGVLEFYENRGFTVTRHRPPFYYLSPEENVASDSTIVFGSST